MTTFVAEADINFTDSAAQKVAELIKEEGNPELKLRVYLSLIHI